MLASQGGVFWLVIVITVGCISECIFWLVCVFAVDYKAVWRVFASLCLRRRLEVIVVFSGKFVSFMLIGSQWLFVASLCLRC